MQYNNNDDYEKKTRVELENIYINSDEKTIKNLAKSALCQLALADEWEPDEFLLYIEKLEEKSKNKDNYISNSNINEDQNITEEELEKMSLFELKILYLKVTDKKTLYMIRSEMSQKALQNEWEPSELNYYLEELDKEKKVKRKKL